MRHIHAIGEIVIDEFDQVSHLIGVARDITHSKEAESQLKESLLFSESCLGANLGH